MAAATIYSSLGYPTRYLTKNHAQMTIRPMMPENKDDLLDFFCRLSPTAYRASMVTSVH